jgi:hypothetical protein
MDWSALIGIGDKLLGIIGRFVPDREKALQLQREVVGVMADVARAEMAAGWLGASWRAIAMLLLTGGLTYRWMLGRLDFADNMVDVTMGLVWLLGMAGYALTPDSIKAALQVLRPPKQEDKR